ncbi:MAG: sulfoxide reductase heme-binding subunit YedZ [Acidobacteriia bacterium]|nr:sulfoxide reductase heme-binding subunit YedZ [Terriglobia bacterium]
MNSILTSKWTKVVVFLACLIPAGLLIRGAITGNLSSNPTQFLEHATGDWTLRFLAITLAISPLRKILGQPQLIRFRRMFGLFAFFYVFCHFCIYLGLDQVLDFHGVWADVMKRRYITVGFTGFVLMIPLAVTSTAGWIRRLGGKRWQMLHRLIYVSAAAGVIHFYWLVKSDVHLPLEYAGVISVLLAWRIYNWYTNPKRGTAIPKMERKSSAPAISD